MIEVLTPPETALVSLAAAKAHLGVTGDDDDAAIEGLIARVSTIIITYIRRPILAGSYLETVTTNGSQLSVALSRFPVSSITSVKLDGSTEAMDSESYSIDTESGLLLRVDSFGLPIAWGRHSVAVTYEAGYADTPADVQHAALTLIGAEWATKGRDPSLKSIGIGSIALGYFTADALPGLASVSHLLEPYRPPAIG
ncbi:head-tail connector protein [Oceanibaculum indicum]|uniref:Phage gp6-like head-tail connector protein n=1 Tax=Oceanibaculum indicum P24 TaxID=1207063 RepID=K2JYW4_9PROT|nr:head-tail connector protein [Oceanibaculum indicum]EKE75519.1 hypothetical protein P24_09871 [Oceanibaculum indicum P24]